MQNEDMIPEHDLSNIPKAKTKKKRVPREPLPPFYNTEKYEYEIGIDEAGRGPMFGRLYVAAVVLPKDGSMNFESLRDSKKISKRQLPCIYDYILEHALAYHVTYIEASEIDEINIREAVMKAMHICAKEIINKIETLTIKNYDFATTDKVMTSNKEKYFLMVDGNDFNPYHHKFSNHDSSTRISYETFTQGDNTFANIAAASILAKVSRDNYIHALCKKHPALIGFYAMNEHMGYGTKKHLDAIKIYGITQFHRRSFGCCKHAKFNVL